MGEKSRKRQEELALGAREYFRRRLHHEMETLGISEEEGNSCLLPEGSRIHKDDPGIFCGVLQEEDHSHFVGADYNFEGNMIAVGGNGSGKSSCIVKPTLYTWKSPMYVVDIKGEHSELYQKLWDAGLVNIPFITVDPTDPEGPSYDVFRFLSKDGEENLVANVVEISRAIIPTPERVETPFWYESERAILSAALLFFYSKGLSFSQAISQILVNPLKDLCEEIEEQGGLEVKNFVGRAQLTSKETLASIELGLRNHLRLFANDRCISHLFRGEREGAKCFSWDYLERNVIFLKIPAHRVDAWSRAITLMHAQLLHYLERRPEKLSKKGKHRDPILLLFDEFARFGKLDSITSALATLRSKKVNICLFVQSVAQLDKIYGEEERRIIFDNCQLRAILRATDPNTQKYLSEMIGTHLVIHESSVATFDSYSDKSGSSLQKHSVREFIVHPHELATLRDIILLTTSGYARIRKRRLDELKFADIPKHIFEEGKSGSNNASIDKPRPMDTPRNPGAKMLTLEERYKASMEILFDETCDEVPVEVVNTFASTEVDRNNYIASKLLQAFPEFKALRVGKGASLERNLFPIEAFFEALANNRELVKQVAKHADCGRLFGVTD